MSKKAKKISLDLSSFDQNSHGFLNKPGEESGQDKVAKKVVTVKITKPKKSEELEKKIGRPLISDEPLISKLGCAVSESEYTKFKAKAGQIAISVFLRDCLKKADLI
jgi:hypothetical protein